MSLHEIMSVFQSAVILVNCKIMQFRVCVFRPHFLLKTYLIKQYNLFFTYVCVYIYIYLSAQLTGAIEYAYCISTKGKTSSTSAQDIVSDVEAPILDLWGMWSTFSLPSLPGPL